MINKPLVIFREQWEEALTRPIRSLANGQTPISILEAGCGKRWGVNLDGVAYTLTGIDLSAKAVAHRLNVTKDLHEGIVGDLRTHDFGDRVFDVIYSGFVLEHIPEAEEVLKRFQQWLKPGGVMIILVPDQHSAYGFAAKFSPHWFHIAFYRYVYGSKKAGTPGNGPFKTTYTNVITRQGIREFCALNDLKFVAEYAWPGGARRRPQWRRAIERAARRTISIASLGKLAHQHDNLMYVIQRPRYPLADREPG